jgi:glycosyltransferase involved in cell wall biosynthesis
LVIGSEIKEGASLLDAIVAVSCRNPDLSGRAEPRPGQAHFSLHLSVQRFMAALALAKIKTVYVARPEIYGTDISRSFLAKPSERIVHIAIGDYASLRILKGAYNIAYVAWEYEAISVASTAGPSLWKNQHWVLSRFDEIWVGAEFVKTTFERYGLKNVHVVPIPIPMPGNEPRPTIEEIVGLVPAVPLYLDFSSQDHAEQQLSALTDQLGSFLYSPARREKQQTFLTVINPGDARKNSEASILGFAQFARDNPDALLIVKLVSSGDIPLSQRIWRTFRIQIHRLVGDGIINSDNIIFIDEFLDETKLIKLMKSVDFYLSTSFAEGLNLPVLEAMVNDTIVISPIHTAMADYLTTENCVVCHASPLIVDGERMTGYPIGRVTCYEASPADIAASLWTAFALSAEERDYIRKRAKDAVMGRYDVESVARLIVERIEAVVQDCPIAWNQDDLH